VSPMDHSPSGNEEPSDGEVAMSRWLEETGGERGRAYEQAFRDLAATGKDIHGEAAFVVDLLAREGVEAPRVLDAGCGTGRVARELARRGVEVVGVDSDASMLDVARAEAPELLWLPADLAALDLPERFDLVLLAGNVVVFLAPGTEDEVVRRCAAHLRPGGLLVSGWRTDRMSRAAYDELTAAAGLEQVARWATWDGEVWREDADWCVAVDRAEETAVDREEETAVDRAEETAVDRAGTAAVDRARETAVDST
jgi:SAM-dependent methyltransferase